LTDWESAQFTEEDALEPIVRPSRPPAPKRPSAPKHPPRSKRPSSHRYRVTRRGRLIRRFIAGVAIFLAVVVVSGVAFFFYAKHKIDAKAVNCTSCVAVKAAAAGAPATPFNVLVLGSDTRAVLNAQDQHALDPTGVDQNSGQRADTIAILHVEPATGKAVLINVPRDLMVPAPGGGNEKINAYYNSGVSGMVSAVESLTGLDINHYVEVNFDSFRTITDALGGVNIYFNQAVYDANSGLRQPKGCDLITGAQALAFVRDRDTDSDFGRIARQQLFVKQMMNKVLTPGTLLNPVKVANLVNLGLGSVTHDSGLTLGTMLRLAEKFHSLSSSSIDFRVLPSYADNTPIGGQLYVLENKAQATALFAALKNNTTLPAYGIQGGVSGIDAAGVPTDVLNGTGAAGLAAKSAATLTAAGFPVEGTGNGPATSSTVVYYTPGNQTLAQYLQQQQYPSAQLEALPSTVTPPAGGSFSSVDAVVVLGQNAVAVSGGTASPSASHTPSPSPSANLLPAGPATAVASQSLARPC
jgi:LCP family protein required for cell wall assembly